MNCADEEMPDTQPCENLTQSQSQDVNSQSQNIWGQLVPSLKSVKWDITFPLIQLSKDIYKAGRDKNCDIEFKRTPINNKHIQVISKVHFYIIRQVINKKNDVVIFLEDNSQNGTFINGKLIGKGNRSVLDNDDIIALSKPSLTVWKFISVNVYEKSGLPKELNPNYALLRKLGLGACGQVLMVYSKLQHKAFAIKAILKHNSTMTNSENHLNDPKRIMNEVRILKALNHPFIIKMEDIVDTPSNLYIVLEFMEGGDLFDRIRSKVGLTEKETKFIFYQLTQAVNYLHIKRITHRDLKPENILLASDSQYPLVKITDFGLSKFVDPQTMMKTFCGTPLYLAPEVLKTGGRGAYTNLVDIWSLGVILYASLSGSVPFSQHNKKVTLHDQILNGQYTFPSQQFAHVSTIAIDLIRKMMTVDPSKRLTIKQVIIHQWLLDRQIKTEVLQLLKSNNENASPNGEQKMINNQPLQSDAAVDVQMRNIHTFGIPEPLSKRPRME